MKKSLFLLLSVLTIVSCVHDEPKPQVKKDYYFKVSPTSSVQFSPGILMYDTLAQEYHFGSTLAEPHLGVFDGHWVDRFVWGHGNDPLFDGEDPDDYQVFYDWGCYPIDDYPINTWRTLTADEWYYLLMRRVNADNLFGMIRVDSVNGFFLLPDNWTDVEEIPLNKGLHKGTSFSSTSYAEKNFLISSQWEKLAEAGAIFFVGNLEAAYWTANSEWEDRAADGELKYKNIYADISPIVQPIFFVGCDCGYMLPVRLVKDFAPKK